MNTALNELIAQAWQKAQMYGRDIERLEEKKEYKAALELRGKADDEMWKFIEKICPNDRLYLSIFPRRNHKK